MDSDTASESRPSSVDMMPPPPPIDTPGSSHSLSSTHHHHLGDSSTVPSMMLRAPAPREILWGELQNLSLLKNSTKTSLFLALLDGIPVVVKAPKHGLSAEETKTVTHELQHECEALANFRHENIIHFFGCGTVSLNETSVVFFIVVEHLSGGTLADRIKSTAVRPTYLNLLKNAFQLANAMHYLHAKADSHTATIHRDLKPDNIGFAADGTLKVFDFGLSTRINKPETPFASKLGRYKLTGETGSVRYMAPEVALHQAYNEKVDVYGFGVILWEALYHRKPYTKMSVQRHREEVCMRGMRPHFEGAPLQPLRELIEMCWAQEINARPSFAEIVERIASMAMQAERHDQSVGEQHGMFRPMNRPGQPAASSTWFQREKEDVGKQSCRFANRLFKEQAETISMGI